MMMFVMMFFMQTAWAQEKPPEWMEGGTIIFVPKDEGAPEKTFSADEWGIFNRKPAPKKKSQKKKPVAKLPKQPKVIEKEVIVYRDKEVFKRHRIGILAGYGANGLSMKNTAEPYRVEISASYGFVLGGQYSYFFDPTWSVSGVLMSDTALDQFSGLAGIGWGF